MDIFQFDSVESYFKAILKELRKGRNQVHLELTRNWARQFDPGPGVYVILEKGQLKYIGETGSLRGRMFDLLNTKNHTLRRTIGEKRFSKHKGYEKASSTKSFSAGIERKLSAYMRKNLTIAMVPIVIGRKEFEEWVISTNSEIDFYNRRKGRASK